MTSYLLRPIGVHGQTDQNNSLGVTGYIGGDALHAISKAHPEFEWTCLVRNSDKGALVAAQYPKVRLVYGDLDSSDLIAEEAAKADIVCNWANCDHGGAANAILAGLSQRSAADQPSHYIHTSGTAILLIQDQQLRVHGEPSSKVYDDVASVGELTTARMPDAAWHRDVDKIVLAAANAPQRPLKTAIVCPPCIYGLGRGPGNARSAQLPELTRRTLQRGRGFVVGAGKARWCGVHVQDLSAVFLALVADAAAATTASEAAALTTTTKATWGPQAYYFAENGEFEWGAVAGLVADECKRRGLIESAELDCLSLDDVEAMVGNPVMGPLWGQNSRCKASRARRDLGWRPVMLSLEEDIARNVAVEAEALGLKKGHAEVAAGNA
ncbi:nucleoside-diphosphate-sugar epimerase [Diplodia corticola]|uniref:Nucleoside-diphosphate-sugar epimerase n=1 Tax=Diplodia corticola TaxID=236234 RepID=A0A1J9R3G7_9PEZI|nr:nucleoside-diphosphate-sugar epimerase [Diplodia corticola]OJD34770.1 nucleoside-diphosphate-sugar epimerase [Diplodia corticola]